MSDVRAWPKPTGVPLPTPKRIVRPCDYGLFSSWNDLEMQLGTIEAYNRIVTLAEAVKKRIDAGDVKAQNPIFAKSIRG